MLFFVFCGTVRDGMQAKNQFVMVLEFRGLDPNFMNFWEYILKNYGMPSTVYLLTSSVRSAVRGGQKPILPSELSTQVFVTVLGVEKVVVLRQSDVMRDANDHTRFTLKSITERSKDYAFALTDDSGHMGKFEIPRVVRVPFVSVRRSDFAPFCPIETKSNS